jgi:hypothetical protein
MLEKIHSCAYVETKKRPFVFALITKERTWYYQAETHAEMESWIQTIRNQLKLVEERSDPHPHEIHLQQPPTLQAGSSRMTSDPISIQTGTPARQSFEMATSPTDYPSLPTSPYSSQPSSFVTGRLRNVSMPSESRPSPLTQTWNPNAESDSDEEPPLSAVLQKTPGDNFVHCQGFLYKLRTIGGIKTWKRHWYVLRNGKFISYKDQSEYEVRRMIELSRALDIIDIEPIRNKPKNAQYLFKVVLPKKSWIMCAETEEDRKNWLTKLKEIHEQVRNIRE